MSNVLLEARRRCLLAVSLSAGLEEVALALGEDASFRDIAALLHEAAEAVADAEEEQSEWSDKMTTAMEALSAEVSPLLPLLKDDGALRQAWKSATEHCDYGVSLGGVSKVKKRKGKLLLDPDAAEAVFQRLDPEFLALVVEAALDDTAYHEAVFKALKAKFEAEAVPAGGEDG